MMAAASGGTDNLKAAVTTRAWEAVHGRLFGASVMILLQQQHAAEAECC